MNPVDFERFKHRVEEFFHAHKNKPLKKGDLVDGLNISGRDVPHLFEALEQLTKENVLVAHKRGKYQYNSTDDHEYIGTIQITKSGPGFVRVPEFDTEIFIKKTLVHNALNGDTVSVEITNEKKRGPEGFVLDVVKRARTRFVGTLQLHPKFGFVKPDDPKIHVDFFIPKRHLNGAQEGQKVVVELLVFGPEHKKPEAKIVEVIGDPDDPGVDIQSVFKAYDINERFESDILIQADLLTMDLSNEEMRQRKDFREWDIFTIDPVDAKDFDDAVSLRELPNGNVELGVHIADVAHFVQEDTPLDKEALRRGCSVYLVDRVIPMLPEKLSNDLCSLVPHKDRLTYSVLMEMDPKTGDKIGFSLHKGIIHSKQRFTYQEVQDLLGDKGEHTYKTVLKNMDTLAKKLRKKRFSRGSIDFHTPEVRFKLDAGGKPIGVERKVQLDSMKLIEEFMLSANQSVAEFIDQLIQKSELDYPGIYRTHDRPSPPKLEFLQAFLHGMGHEVRFPDGITPKIFQDLVGPLLKSPEADIINDVAVRSMMKAIYSAEPTGHFGLGFDHYSHFTSPIRRYPDLILHRMLLEYQQGINAKRRRHFRRLLPGVCEQCSQTERQAQQAERESVRLKQIEFISDHLYEEFDAKISGITDNGLYAEIDEFLIEGFIAFRNMKDDRYNVDAKTMTAIGNRHGKTYSLGQRVRIRVADVNRSLQTIDFEFMDHER